MKFYSIFFIIIYLLSFPIFTETILLKGNETIRGKIKNQNINSIKVEVNGEIVEISKDRILKIVYIDLTKSDEDKIRAEEEKANEELPPIKLREEDKKNLIENNTKLTEEKTNDKEIPKPVEPPPNETTQTINTEPIAIPKEEPPLNKNYPSRLAVTTRSALLPGWGQFTEKRILPGIAFPTVIIGLAGLITNENKKHQNAVNQYNSLSNPILLGGLILNSSTAPPPPENTFLLFYSQSSTANNSNVSSSRNFSYALIGVYIINIIDAYIFYNESLFTKGFFFDYNIQSVYGQTHINHLNSKVDQMYTFGYTVQY